jgi:AraC-like DNA-binding protein
MPVERRVATALPDAVSTSATDPVGRHLTVIAAGSEKFSHAREVHRDEGVGFTILCATTAGSGWVRSRNIVHQVPVGTIFLLAADEPHAYGTWELPWTIWWLDMVGVDLADLARAAGFTPDAPVMRPRDMTRVAASMGDILRCLELDALHAGGAEASGLAWKLMTLLAADRRQSPRAEPVERAKTWIAEHLDHPLTVDGVAEVVGLSPSRLLVLFRESTGGGVIAYQTSLRMVRARQLLDGSTAPVSEIASHLGYSDPYYFSRIFRRVHGMSPSRYRGRSRP